MFDIWSSSFYYLDGTKFYVFPEEQVTEVYFTDFEAHLPDEYISLEGCIADGIWMRD